MPARTRQSHSEVAEPDEGTAALHCLKFSQSLTWRVGRSAIPVADLLARLRTLAEELRNLEQEEVNKDSLKKVSQELATLNLLGHKDRGVRSWTACCIVDVLRLCAPDAPFTGHQLKDIFTCIITSIIPVLADPSNSYNAQHIYVLNSLAEVKSIVLLTDLDHPDTLIISLFTSCFDIVAGSSKASTGEEVAKNVEFDMTRLLVTVMDETSVLAPEVVDVIVAQFLRVDPHAIELRNKKGKKPDTPLDAKQDTLLLKDYPAAYNMAKAICQACPERMTSHISQYFNNVIIDASAPSMETNGSSKHLHRKPALDESDEEREDIRELSKAHRLIRELWRACPEVLQNVIPQVEAELSAESVSLRLLATQTLGDLAAGVGVAGPPSPPPMDPVAYPPVTLTKYPEIIPQPSALQAPLSPKPFSQVHTSAYESFLSRRFDKSASVRSAWATVVGRIILTSAGGSGLSEHEEEALIKNLASMLRDVDEKVRVAAVDAISSFGFSHIVSKLGARGNFLNPDSVLSILAERVKDRRPIVREHAMRTLARMWAVASGDIERNHEFVTPLLNEAPSKIFDAYYTNDMDIHALLDRVLFEILLPLNYPPIKSKAVRTGSSQSQNHKDSQNSEDDMEIDADTIRVRRILTLLKGLDEKSKKVFFAMQARQLTMRNAITVYLQACDEYNGGVIEKDADRIKAQLTRVVDGLAKTFPDSSRASADLWKFAKVHDRRSYQLIRFAMAAVSDYRTVTKAIKEMTRRMQNSNNGTLLDTLTPLMYRCSSLIFNRSHIPAIMKLSKTDEHGMGNAAQDMLKEISVRNPEVLEAQIQEMCRDLETQAPGEGSSDQSSPVEILKACSGFAKKLPAKLPKERKFLQALSSYALYTSSPRAAKHAVSILLAVADKKEMYAKGLIRKCVEKWSYGSDYFLVKLAALSQLCLLAPAEVEEESDAVLSIALDQVLLTNRSPQLEAEYAWSDEVDEETLAKEWAIRILVNRVRSKAADLDDGEFGKCARPLYETLNKLITGEGELSERKDTPGPQKSRLRLLAAKSVLKLCASHRLCDQFFTPRDFNSIALVAQDPLLPVRSSFIGHLKKLLVQTMSFSHRWYAIPCLLAFEPSASLKNSTSTWLRSRAAFFAQQTHGGQQTVLETVFSRLLSLLAYHPDYPSADLDEATKTGDLADFARYILFYLVAVANERNLSLIYHIAQRVKQARDGIIESDEITTRLHTLSDLAQATIHKFADAYSQQHKSGGGTGNISMLETYPGKIGLPSSIFAPMANHQEAQEVAEKNFLAEEVDEVLDRIVRSVMKPKSGSHSQSQVKKRKPEASDLKGDTNAAKKVKKEREKPIRPHRSSTSADTSKVPRMKTKIGDDSSTDDEGAAQMATTVAQRRSSRGTTKKTVNYADRDSDEDDQEMENWVQSPEEMKGASDDGDEDARDEHHTANGDETNKTDDEQDQDQQHKPKNETPNGKDKEKTKSALTEMLNTPTVLKSKKSRQAPESKGKEPRKTSVLPTRKSSRRK